MQRSVRRSAQTVNADESSRAAFRKMSDTSFAAQPIVPVGERSSMRGQRPRSRSGAPPGHEAVGPRAETRVPRARTEDALRDCAEELDVVGLDGVRGAQAREVRVERLLVRREQRVERVQRRRELG